MKTSVAGIISGFSHSVFHKLSITFVGLMLGFCQNIAAQ